MSAIFLAILGIGAYVLGYLFYSKYLSRKIFQLDPDYQTPSHIYKDGVDYVPTNRYVLLGHHFTSIAGAAPIIGPSIAIYWGWAPAVLWVVLGTIFAAGVHDFGAIVISVRHKGQSMGTLARGIIGERGRILLLFIILMLVVMVNAVFSWAISKLFISFPGSVIPVFIGIPLALWIGGIVYRNKGEGLLIPSLLALVAMYGSAVLTTYVPVLQIDIPAYFGGPDVDTGFGLNGMEMAFLIWITILMIYGYFASTLPVWRLLQPRDFINSHQLILGLGAFYLGLFILNPSIQAPAFNEDATDVSWFPLLFVTIACGAISGFHGLVSSGTTSKQLDKETDARPVGYIGSLGEGSLALIAIIAGITVFASTADFKATYHSFAAAGNAGIGVFVKGAASLTDALGIPNTVGRTIISVIIVSFAATSLDTSIRLMRYIISELGDAYKIEPLKNMHVATSITVISSAALAFIPEGPRGFGSGGYLLWPLFGTSNQLLAGITLMLITIWLKRSGRNYLPTLIPMAFLLFMTIWALATSVFGDWFGKSDTMLLFVLGALILTFSIWILLEALGAFKKKVEVDS